MTGRRLAALVLAIASAVVSTPASATLERQIILILTPGRPYEDVLADLRLMSLTGAGGIGLLTTSGEAQGRTQAAVSLGAGRSVEDTPDAISFDAAGKGLLVDATPFHDAAGDAEPGLLGSTLAEAGRTVGYVDLRGGGADPAMLLAMDSGGRIPLASLNAFPVLTEFPAEFLSPDAVGIVEEADVLVSHDPQIVPFALEHTEASELMVILVTTPPSEAMRARGDTVTPVVIARGQPEAILSDGQPAGLTSDTARRAGVVSNIDVAPTVLDFLGVEIPDEMAGSAIRIEGPPPTQIHRRYLEWRGVVGPVTVAAPILAVLTLLAGFVLAIRRRRPNDAVLRAAATAGLASLALFVVVVPASLLPMFSWPVVIVALLAGTGAVVAAVVWFGRRNPVLPLVLVAVLGMAMVLLDVAFGWVSGSTPLLGGSALDGERFFGLGNPYAGIVLSGAVLGAAFFTPRAGLRAGVGMIVAASLLAGLPMVGADLGGGLTLAIVAGLWFGISRWDHLGGRAWGVAAVAGLVAFAVFAVTHRYLPPGGTHVSRAVSGAGGIIGVLEVFWHRLMLNIQLTSETPSAWLAVLGLPVWLWVGLRPPRALRPAFEAEPVWRRAVIVLALGGIFGYVLNDTFGMAGITFLFLSGAIVYPAIRLRLEGATETAPATAPAGG